MQGKTFAGWLARTFPAYRNRLIEDPRFFFKVMLIQEYPSTVTAFVPRESVTLCCETNVLQVEDILLTCPRNRCAADRVVPNQGYF